MGIMSASSFASSEAAHRSASLTELIHATFGRGELDDSDLDDDESDNCELKRARGSRH